jgi:hypothetical protein
MAFSIIYFNCSKRSRRHATKNNGYRCSSIWRYTPFWCSSCCNFTSFWSFVTLNRNTPIVFSALGKSINCYCNTTSASINRFGSSIYSKTYLITRFYSWDWSLCWISIGSYRTTKIWKFCWRLWIGLWFLSKWYSGCNSTCCWKTVLFNTIFGVFFPLNIIFSISTLNNSIKTLITIL